MHLCWEEVSVALMAISTMRLAGSWFRARFLTRKPW